MMSPTEPTVGLVMIVKDEEATLPRLAATLEGQIDHWTIVDTGSTDGTGTLARELFRNVPGQVIEDGRRGCGPSPTGGGTDGPMSSWPDRAARRP